MPSPRVAAEGAEDLQVAQGLLVQDQAVAAGAEAQARHLVGAAQGQGVQVAQQRAGGGAGRFAAVLLQAEGRQVGHLEMVQQGLPGEGGVKPGGVDLIDDHLAEGSRASAAICPGSVSSPTMTSLTGCRWHRLSRLPVSWPQRNSPVEASSRAQPSKPSCAGQPGQAVAARSRVHQFGSGGGARADDLHHLALDQALGLGGILHLLADGHGQPGLEQAGQVGVEGVVGHAGQGHRVVALGVAAGQGHAGHRGQGLGVLEEGLVEIAHAEQQQDPDAGP